MKFHYKGCARERLEHVQPRTRPAAHKLAGPQTADCYRVGRTAAVGGGKAQQPYISFIHTEWKKASALSRRQQGGPGEQCLNVGWAQVAVSSVAETLTVERATARLGR